METEMEVVEVALVVLVAALDQGYWRSLCHSRMVLRRRFHNMHQDPCNCHKLTRPPTCSSSISMEAVVWEPETEE